MLLGIGLQMRLSLSFLNVGRFGCKQALTPIRNHVDSCLEFSDCHLGARHRHTRLDLNINLQMCDPACLTARRLNGRSPRLQKRLGQCRRKQRISARALCLACVRLLPVLTLH